LPNQSTIDSPGGSRSYLIFIFGVVVICRLVLSTARRFAYPFAPVLSRALGVPLTAITSLIAVNWATSLVGIFFGPLADRIGYKQMMILAMLMLAAGMLAGGCYPVYGLVLIALFLSGMAKVIFDPALQAYVSAWVPYHRRGMAIGLLEISWAGSTLVGIPITALLIDNVGWHSPFIAFGVVGLLSAICLVLLMPKSEPMIPSARRPVYFKSVLPIMVKDKTVLGVFGYVFFFSAAIDNLFVVYGAWLEKAFDVGIVALGLGTIVIGVAELIGEIMVATIADRFGLKRGITAGILLCIVTYGLLPFASRSLSLAWSGLFFHFLFFEFTIISSVALCTELLPEMRATMMAFFLAAAGLGRILGALIGGPIWLAGGIFATGLSSVVLTVLALTLLRWGLRGWVKG
jgi:predicted MFS family arabinose efflux permease